METIGFGQRLIESIAAKRSHVVVGFDPDYEAMPAEVVDRHPRNAYGSDEEMAAACYKEFLLGVLSHVAEDVVAVKLQVACFEALGAAGWELYEELIKAAREQGLLVIADAKRGDIGKTAEAYARAHLDRAGADAMTVNPYLGSDSLEPFFKRVKGEGKGVFVLVKTSNPGSGELQDLEVAAGEPLYQRVARLVGEWGAGTEGSGGYMSVGAVVGGTHPEEGRRLRGLMQGVPLLVPGYGAQGAVADDLAGFFDAAGSGAVVNSSRGILCAYGQHPEMDWRDAAREEAARMKRSLWEVSRRG